MNKIALTLGEPAGIGLELIVQLAQQNQLQDCVLIGDTKLIRQALPNFPEAQIEHLPLAAENRLGQLNPKNAKYVLQTIKTAALGCLENRYQAMVTCPIHKAIINQAGIPFSGHTEYLAELTETPKVVMMLLNQTMRVALITTHLPLRQVADHITAKNIQQTIKIVHHDLQNKFGIKQPRLAVCGLNPHAGEDGHLGHEELDIIIPAINQLKAQGLELSGPFPADSLFTPDKVKNYHAIIAMYHDQGLAPLKYSGFGESVNITLGLPIIRTSVDHGTALDIAGKNQANAGSLQAAIELARQCIQKTSS